MSRRKACRQVVHVLQALVNLGLWSAPCSRYLARFLGWWLHGLWMSTGVHLSWQQHHLAQGAGGVAHFVVAGNGRRLACSVPSRARPSASGLPSWPANRLLMNPALRLAMLTNLPTVSLLTRADEVGGVEVHVFDALPLSLAAV